VIRSNITSDKHEVNMPDISMCSNNDKCEKRETCYRNTAKPDSWQSYIDFYAEKEPNEKCGYYWKVEKIIDKDKEN